MKSTAPSLDAGADAFVATAANVYVAKVKNVLVGLAPTDDEVNAVEADGAALGALVDGWMQLPEYDRKMMRFFELSFQQTQITSNDFADQVHGQLGLNPSTTPLLLRNAEESFARTMLALTAAGHPFTEAMTTKQLMMTTALKELYAFLDTVEIDDDSNTFDHFRAEKRAIQIEAEAARGPIPISETLDESSPNYMHWYNPDVTVAGAGVPGCQQDPVLLPTQAITLHYLLLGSIDGHKLIDESLCPVWNGTPSASQLTAHDFDDWTMVTLRDAAAGETTTTFYDLPSLRTATELVVSMPRSGFFSTPAFFANWPTNVSNQMRVTMHQTLIVATGSSIDGTDTTVPSATPGLDVAHASDAACESCHRLLDPTRSIASSTWTWNYHNQHDVTWTAEPGLFAFRGVVQPVKTISDFGATLAAHPLVASGWTQKLCTYVNSAPCDESDPEFQRIVALFETSNHSWRALVKALVTSPLTTHAADTVTARTNGEVVAIARRDHLCAAIDARLGLDGACDAIGADSAATIPAIVSGLPSDAYGRGAVAPILPNEPTLFFRAGIENICESLATDVVDPVSVAPSTAKRWSSANADAAIDAFVHEVMALPSSDPRAAPAVALLKAHFASALEQPGMTATDALRSTFIVACSAPSTISIGL